MKPSTTLPTACGQCGKDPADGQATAYDKGLIRLCHDDGAPDSDRGTCYQKWQPSQELTAPEGFGHS